MIELAAAKIPYATDLDIWKIHFDRYNVKYTVSNHVESKGNWPAHTSIDTDEGKGYGGFTFCARFDMNGKFIEYGVWE